MDSPHPLSIYIYPRPLGGRTSPQITGGSVTPVPCLWHKLERGFSGVCQMASSFCSCMAVSSCMARRLHVPLPARLPLCLCQASLHHTLGGLDQEAGTTLFTGGHRALGLRPELGLATWCCSSCPQGLCWGGHAASGRGTTV